MNKYDGTGYYSAWIVRKVLDMAKCKLVLPQYKQEYAFCTCTDIYIFKAYKKLKLFIVPL